MSCCRCSRVVDVEVAGQGDVAVVDGVIVVDDETAQSRRRKKMRYDGAADVDDAPCGCQRVPSSDESTDFAKIGRSPSSTHQFCQNRVAV